MRCSSAACLQDSPPPRRGPRQVPQEPEWAPGGGGAVRGRAAADLPASRGLGRCHHARQPSGLVRTKEMMQPCRIRMHVISLVAYSAAPCRHRAPGSTKEIISPVSSTHNHVISLFAHGAAPCRHQGSTNEMISPVSSTHNHVISLVAHGAVPCRHRTNPSLVGSTAANLDRVSP